VLLGYLVGGLALGHVLVAGPIVPRAKGQICAKPKTIVNLVTLAITSVEGNAYHIMWGNKFYTAGEGGNGSLGRFNPRTVMKFGLKEKVTILPRCIPYSSHSTLSQIKF